VLYVDDCRVVDSPGDDLVILDRDELSKLAEALGGLPVLACFPKSPADRAGIRYGDIVLAVNGIKTPDWATFIQARAKDERYMRVDLFRNGTYVTVELDLEDSTPLDPPTLLAEILSERIVPYAPSDSDDIGDN